MPYARNERHIRKPSRASKVLHPGAWLRRKYANANTSNAASRNLNSDAIPKVIACTISATGIKGMANAYARADPRLLEARLNKTKQTASATKYRPVRVESNATPAAHNDFAVLGPALRARTIRSAKAADREAGLNAPAPCRSPRSSSWRRRVPSPCCRGRTRRCRCPHSLMPATAC